MPACDEVRSISMQLLPCGAAMSSRKRGYDIGRDCPKVLVFQEGTQQEEEQSAAVLEMHSSKPRPLAGLFCNSSYIICIQWSRLGRTLSVHCFSTTNIHFCGLKIYVPFHSTIKDRQRPENKTDNSSLGRLLFIPPAESWPTTNQHVLCADTSDIHTHPKAAPCSVDIHIT